LSGSSSRRRRLPPGSRLPRGCPAARAQHRTLTFQASPFNHSGTSP